MNRSALLLAALMAVSCQARGPEAVARRFMDAYFIEIDQAKALTFTSGLAHSKLEEELDLVTQVRQDTGVPKERPRVSYQKRRDETTAERAKIVYDVTSEMGRDQLKKHVLLSLEKLSESWTVANYIIQDGHVPTK